MPHSRPSVGYQGGDPFQVAKFARDAVGVDDFLSIDSTDAYTEWLEYRFFYGLGNISYRADSNTNGTIVLVGPPRVRQVCSAQSRPLLPLLCGRDPANPPARDHRRRLPLDPGRFQMRQHGSFQRPAVRLFPTALHDLPSTSPVALCSGD